MCSPWAYPAKGSSWPTLVSHILLCSSVTGWMGNFRKEGYLGNKYLSLLSLKILLLWLLSSTGKIKQEQILNQIVSRGLITVVNSKFYFQLANEKEISLKMQSFSLHYDRFPYFQGRGRQTFFF